MLLRDLDKIEQSFASTTSYHSQGNKVAPGDVSG
jgi:hypothetical protein